MLENVGVDGFEIALNAAMAIHIPDYEIHTGYNCRAVATLSFGVVASVFTFRNFVFIQEIRKIINIANLPNTSGSGDFYCL